MATIEEIHAAHPTNKYKDRDWMPFYAACKANKIGLDKIREFFADKPGFWFEQKPIEVADSSESSSEGRVERRFALIDF